MADCAHLGLAPLDVLLSHILENHFFPTGEPSLLQSCVALMVLGISASSPPGGVTPHSARKVQKMPVSGISSELRAHQIAPGGVVAHPSPPAGVDAHSSPPAGVVARGISIAVSSFGFSLPYLVASGFGIGSRVWMLE